jgi:DNA polymerase elongation subunit (family B)
LEGFYDLIAETDPEIITGYNIYSFDNPYLWVRTQINRVKINPKASRLIHQAPFYKDGNSWYSKGYGHKTINQIKMGGRIDIDVIFYIRANYKLKKNTLDFAARAVLNKNKYDLPYRQMFADYYFYVRSRYLVENHERVSDNTMHYFFKKTYLDVRTNLVETIRKLENLEAESDYLVDFFNNIRNCSYIVPEVFVSVKDTLEKMFERNHPKIAEICEKFGLKDSYDFYLEYRHKTKNYDPNVTLEKRIQQIKQIHEVGKTKLNNIVKYNSVDTNLTYEIFEKVGLYTSNLELCNIVGINIEDVLNRGQQIRGISTIYNECHPLGININKIRADTDVEFMGGYVFEPIKGLHEDVICIDFASLYPNIMRGNNLCYSTFLPESKWHTVKKEDCTCIKFIEDKSKKKREYRFVKKHIRVGVLPNLIKKLLDGRYKVKKLMGAETDPLVKSALNKKQLAIKVCANSIYGLTGTKQETGKLPLKALSSSVTALGREYIKMAAKYVETHYGATVVYGDTDSIMFKIPGVVGAACIEKGHAIAKEISESGIYPDPCIEFAFEKAGRILTIVKKKYIYWKYDDRKFVNGKPNPGYGKFMDLRNNPFALEQRGIILVRRDNCAWYKKIYRTMLYDILEKKNVKHAYNNLKKELIKLINGQIDVHDLTIYGAMGSNYKKKQYKMSVFRDCLKARGQIIYPGERFGFIVVKINKENAYMGEKMRLIEEYDESVRLGQKMEIDISYYLNLITENMDQIWSGYYNVLEPTVKLMEDVKYKRIIDSIRNYDSTGLVDKILNETKSDKIKAFDKLNEFAKTVTRHNTSEERKLKQGIDNTRKHYLTGRKVFNYDLYKPLKTIYNAYNKNRICEVIDTLETMIA